jgi:hypothetical protein
MALNHDINHLLSDSRSCCIGSFTLSTKRQTAFVTIAGLPDGFVTIAGLPDGIHICIPKILTLGSFDGHGM